MSAAPKALREALKPASDAILAINDAVRSADDAELDWLSRAPLFLTETNCGWHEYVAARIVAPIAHIEIQRRKKLAEDGGS